jgi:hypothetical protein
MIRYSIRQWHTKQRKSKVAINNNIMKGNENRLSNWASCKLLMSFWLPVSTSRCHEDEIFGSSGISRLVNYQIANDIPSKTQIAIYQSTRRLKSSATPLWQSQISLGVKTVTTDLLLVLQGTNSHKHPVAIQKNHWHTTNNICMCKLKISLKECGIVWQLWSQHIENIFCQTYKNRGWKSHG